MATQRQQGFWIYNEEWPLVLAGDEPEAEEVTLAPRDISCIHVFQAGDSVVLTAELPGLARDEIDVEVECEHITISGHRHPAADAGCCRQEHLLADFTRTVTLPVQVEIAMVTAQLKDGVLEVRAPRRPPQQRIHVDVTAP